MTFFLTTYYLHSFCFNTWKLVYHISLRHENITIHPAKIHNKFYYHNNGILSPKPELWILFISGSYPSNDHIIIIKAKPISYCNKYSTFTPTFYYSFWLNSKISHCIHDQMPHIYFLHSSENSFRITTQLALLLHCFFIKSVGVPTPFIFSHGLPKQTFS